MGVETIAGLAISALAAGAGAMENKRVADRQNDIADERTRMQQRKQREGDVAINAELDKMKGSNPDAQRQKSFQDFMGMLMANRGSATGGQSPVAGSKRFQAESASAGAGIKNYGTARAGNLADIAAPGRQRRDEAISRGRLGDTLSGVSRDANAEDFLLQLKANSTRPNPWVMAASQFGQGAGSAMSGRMAPITDADLMQSTTQNFSLDPSFGRNLSGDLGKRVWGG